MSVHAAGCVLLALSGTSWDCLPLSSLVCFFSSFLDPKTATETETEICAEWEIKTITSALKTYLR